MSAAAQIPIGRIYAVAAVLLTVAISSAAALGANDAETANLAARYSARVSFLMFMVVVMTGPAARLWKGSMWTRLARRRRHLGLAFAALMFGHLVALGINVIIYNPRPASETVVGVVIYGFIAALALTSTDTAQRRMGKWWRRLHWLGVTAILLTFLGSYGLRLFDPDYFWTGLVFAPIAAGALLVRIVTALRR